VSFSICFRSSFNVFAASMMEYSVSMGPASTSGLKYLIAITCFCERLGRGYPVSVMLWKPSTSPPG
jgi:hypothetical protein